MFKHDHLDMYDVVHKPSAELFAKKKLDIDWMPGWRPLPASTPAVP